MATGDESCAINNEGPLCAVCSENYFYVSSTNTCQTCHESTAWFDSFTICVLIISSIGLLLGVYRVQCKMREQNITSFNEAIIFAVLKLKLLDASVFESAPLAVEENISMLRKRLRALGKVYISFFQILSTIPSVLSFDELPEVHRNQLAALDAAFNIGISRSAIYACLSGAKLDFIDRLLMDTIYPMVVLVLFICVYYLHVTVKLKVNPPLPPSSDSTAFTSLRSKYVGVFLFFTYLILPSLTATIFETFPCQNVDPDGVEGGDNRYLRADYSISCHSSRYKFARVWAVLMIFVYVLGLPGFYAYLLYCNRDEIRSRDVSGLREVHGQLERQGVSAQAVSHPHFVRELQASAVVLGAGGDELPVELDRISGAGQVRGRQWADHYWS